MYNNSGDKMKEKFIKYSELLLSRGLDIKEGQSLVICAPVESYEFIRILSNCALKKGVNDIYFDWYDEELKYQQLINLSKEDLGKSLFWNKKVYDEYAKKDAAFLMFVSDNSDIMGDVDSEIVSYTSKINRTSRPLYKKRQLTNEIAWCIASVSTFGWANKVFSGSDDCVNKLWEVIFDTCLVNTDDPISSWNNKVLISNKRSNKLNELNFKSLHYTNSLGTDLYIGLSNNTMWQGAGDIMDDGRRIICNIPTEEIFTTPNRTMTNGRVYSSLPLVYNGVVIEDFMLEFKDGKVVDFDARKGRDVLGSIINGDDNSCYLGEVALVEYDSPIRNSGILFYTTLFDENASCHLALGNGFPDCLNDTKDKSSDELIVMGINISDVHVDFMIGTSDLKIVGVTYDNEEIVVFDNGNFVLDV